MRAISAPPSRPEQLMRMPWAPNRIADWTARFMARRKATRRSNCWAMPSAISFASISGFRISMILRLTSLFVTLAMSPRNLSMSAPFLPMTTPGRAECKVMRVFFAARRAAAAARVETLHDKSPADRRFLDIEPVDIELVVVLGVGDRRLEYLPYILRDAAAREGQLGQSVRRVLAADRLRDKVQLLRAAAQRAQKRGGFIVGETAGGGLLAHLRSSLPACRRHGRKRCGSARTRRACGRSCSRSPAPG